METVLYADVLFLVNFAMDFISLSAAATLGAAPKKPLRLSAAIEAAFERPVPRMVVELPGTVWESAGVERSAQHFAITLLDALCAALAN